MHTGPVSNTRKVPINQVIHAKQLSRALDNESLIQIPIYNPVPQVIACLKALYAL